VIPGERAARGLYRRLNLPAALPGAQGARDVAGKAGTA
jgi:hypothetical protein